MVPRALHEAASIAVATHPAIAAARSEARSLQASYRGAKWLRFPNLSVDALAVTGGNGVGTRDGLALNATVEQPIWAGGRVGGQIRRARAEWNAAQNREEAAAQDVALSVVAAFYDLALAEARHGVLIENLSQHAMLLASIERRVNREVSPRADLILGRSRVAQIELELAGAQELAASARARLDELTGGAPVQPDHLPASPALAAEMPAEGQAIERTLACNPALAALDDAETAARAAKTVARSGLFPEVLGQLSHNEITGSRAAVVVRAQTGNGLGKLSAIEGAQARIEQVSHQHSDTVRALREALRSDYARLRSAMVRLSAGDEAADTAGQITESYKRQFVAGRRGWLDVMNAVREAGSARIARVDADNAAMRSAARIMLLSCAWEPGTPDQNADGGK